MISSDLEKTRGRRVALASVSTSRYVIDNVIVVDVDVGVDGVVDVDVDVDVDGYLLIKKTIQDVTEYQNVIYDSKTIVNI